MSAETACAPNNVDSELVFQDSLLCLLLQLSTYTETFENNADQTVFDCLPDFFRGLGRFLTDCDIPLVVFSIKSDENKNSEKIYSGYFIQSARDRYRRKYIYQLVDDTKKTIRRFLNDVKQICSDPPPEITWRGDYYTHDVGEPRTTLRLIANDTNTEIFNSELEIMCELERYLLATYVLRTGCEGATSIPWEDVHTDMVADGENYVEKSRLPIVSYRKVYMALILRSPPQMIPNYRLSLALHIKKGELGILEENRRFRWTLSENHWTC